MTTRIQSKDDFKTGIAKALLSNTPAATEFAQRFGLSPDEMRTVIHEAILHLEGAFIQDSNDIPITAMPPSELMRLGSHELRMLLSNYPGFEERKPS